MDLISTQAGVLGFVYLHPAFDKYAIKQYLSALDYSHPLYTELQIASLGPYLDLISRSRHAMILHNRLKMYKQIGLYRLQFRHAAGFSFICPPNHPM